MTFRISLAQANNKAKQNSKARAEAETKEREDAEEYNRVLAEFEEEHGSGDSIVVPAGPRIQVGVRDVVVPTGQNRHFAERVRTGKSGPGTLEMDPSFGYTPGRFGVKQQSGYNGPNKFPPSNRDTKMYTTIIGKASNLPLHTDTASVKALFSEYPSLKVENIEKLPSSGPAFNGRSSFAMLITFDKDAVLAEFTEAMKALSDKKYLGRGYYLHLDRYLGDSFTSTAEQRREPPAPFGAKLKVPKPSKGFAPPPDLGGAYRGRGGGFQPPQEEARMVVTVERPQCMHALRLIHRTIEGVINGGMEFEAALMEDSRVTDNERFVWLYDSTHPYAIYYIWKLNQMIRPSAGKVIFEGEAEWEGPEPLPDEFAYRIEDLDPDYEEPEIDEPEDKLQRGFVGSSSGFLSPWDRTFLIWLLAESSTGDLKAKDVAAFTAFAVDHVNQGMDEVIDLLITNIIVPFNLTEAKIDVGPAKQQIDKDEHSRQVKQSKSSSNGLLIVSDLALTTYKDRNLSHTWKCRQIIGERLVERKVFEHLDQLPGFLQLTPMKDKSYREEIQSVLSVWSKEELFDKDCMLHFNNAFNEWTSPEKQLSDEATRKKPVRKIVVGKKDSSRNVVNRTLIGVVDKPESKPSLEAVETVEAESPMESVVANPESEEAPPNDAEMEDAPASVDIPGETAAARARRMRPKAEDMFASDDE